MRVLDTTIRRESDEFRRNQAHYEGLMADLHKHLESVRAGGSADALALHKQRGKLTARERIKLALRLGRRAAALKGKKNGRG